MATKRALALALFVLLTCISVGCARADNTILVNIQVTGANNMKPMIEELDKRGIKSTVWLDAEEISQNGEYIGELSAHGHEIAGKFDAEITSETSYYEQKGELLEILEVASRYVDQKITGFRATRFTANEYTYTVMDELGMEYLVRSARDELLSVYTFRPYRLEGHGFAILPMPIRCAFGESGSLCDTSSRGKLSPDQLRLYMCAAIDNNIKIDEPLILEWHPEITYPGDPEGWWDTFIAVLDYLENKGDAVQFVTANQILEKYLYDKLQ